MTRAVLVLTMVLCWSWEARAQMGMSGGPGQGGGVPGQGAPARDSGTGADIEGLSEELGDADPMVRLQAVRELAAAWIVSARAKTAPTPSELRMQAHAYITLGEPARALELLDRAAAAGGPYGPEIRADAAAIRAALRAGASPDRVRLGVAGGR